MKSPALTSSLALNVLLVLVGVAAGAWGVHEMTAFTDRHHERRQTQFERLEPRGGVLFVGDSITEGGLWSELFGRPDVWNRGIGGDTTAGVLTRIDSLVEIAPRRVFLMIGVNDLNRGVPRAQTLRNFEAILATFERELPAATVSVQSVLPVSSDWAWTSNDEIRSLNAELEAIVRARGLEWIDLAPLFTDANGDLEPALTNDGIHLLGPGYTIWRDHIADRLGDG